VLVRVYDPARCAHPSAVTGVLAGTPSYLVVPLLWRSMLSRRLVVGWPCWTNL
jgi:hypothetical protein